LAKEFAAVDVIDLVAVRVHDVDCKVQSAKKVLSADKTKSHFQCLS